MLKVIDNFLLVSFFQPLSYILEKITRKNNFFWAKVSVLVYTLAFCYLAFIFLEGQSDFILYALIVVFIASGMSRITIITKLSKDEDFPGREAFESAHKKVRKFLPIIIPFFVLLLVAQVLLVPSFEALVWLVWVKSYVLATYLEVCVPIPVENKTDN